MARPLRIEVAGGLYYVASRGNGRDAIYFSDADREAWLMLFGQVCARFDWRCYAWCQMTNHYHFVVETRAPNLSRGMRQLNGVYTQYVNRTHGRVGHVFQGRYKEIPVERDAYLLEMCRYVPLDPVRAGMVRDVAHWRWSSYRSIVGAAPRPSWLETEWLLENMNPDPVVSMRAYGDFGRDGVQRPAPWQALRGQIHLGGETFLERVQADLRCIERGTRDGGEIPRAQRRPSKRPLEAYSKDFAVRDDAMAAANASGDYTLRQIANAFGVHYATVSRAVRRRSRAPECPT